MDLKECINIKYNGSFNEKIYLNDYFRNNEIKEKVLSEINLKKDRTLYRPSFYFIEFYNLTTNEKIYISYKDNDKNEYLQFKLFDNLESMKKYYLKKSKLKSVVGFSFNDDDFKNLVYDDL